MEMVASAESRLASNAVERLAQARLKAMCQTCEERGSLKLAGRADACHLSRAKIEIDANAMIGPLPSDYWVVPRVKGLKYASCI